MVDAVGVDADDGVDVTMMPKMMIMMMMMMRIITILTMMTIMMTMVPMTITMRMMAMALPSEISRNMSHMHKMEPVNHRASYTGL